MTEEPLSCPRCRINMDKEVKEEVIIDRCPKCGGVFLDGGELEKVQNQLNLAAPRAGQKRKNVLCALMRKIMGRSKDGD